MSKYLRNPFVLLPFLFALCQQAQAQFPYTETFKNATAPGVVFGGTPTAFLTASNSTDPNGSGYLRLTNNTNNQRGFAYNNTASFPSNYGVDITFEYFTYGGTGADGIAFFLFDAATTSFAMGAFGGSLGYAQGCSASGMTRAYMGIALDEFGNFSNPADNCHSGGPGRQTNAVAVRGPGNGSTATDYPYVAGQQTTSLSPSWNLTPGGSSRIPDSTQTGYRRAHILLSARTGGGFNVTVQITRGGITRTTTTVLNNIPFTYTPPAQFKFGFASSSGGQNNYHEIRNVSITVDPSALLTNPTAVNDNGGNVCSGQSKTVTVVTNDATTNSGGTINAASVDLNPSIAGIQTSISTSAGTFTADSAAGIVTFTALPAFTGTASTPYVVNDTYGKTSNQATTSFTVVAPATTANAGADQQHCNASAFIMAANTPAVGTGTWTVVSGAATITTPASPTSPVTVAAGNTATLRWTVGNGTCSNTDDVVLTNYAPPTTAAAGPNQNKCNTSSFTMAANTPTVGTGSWSVINGVATITNAASPTTIVTISSGYGATLRWTTTNGTCTSASDVTLILCAPATQCTGSLGDPIFKETFGSAGTATKPTVGPALAAGLTTYTYFSPALFPNQSLTRGGVTYQPSGPVVGQYTISNSTRGYNNPYFVDQGDHTSTDGTGYCMVVDANATPGKFYEQTITGLCSGTTFEFSAWVININNEGAGFSSPSLRFDILDAGTGAVISSLSTGTVAPGMGWTRLAGTFQMPAGGSNTVKLQVYSNTPSSSGNDLALDDIAFAPCGPTVTLAQSVGTVCSGGATALNVSLPVNSYANYFFQLQKRALGTTTWANEGALISNGTNNQYSFPITNAQSGFEYRTLAAGDVSTINTANCRVASTPAELKVIAFITGISAGIQTLCYNTATTLTAAPMAKAGTGTPASGYSYAWESSTNGTNWSAVSGITSATLNTGNLTATTYYRVTATVNGCSGDGVSATDTVKVNPQITITPATVPAICVSTTSFTIPYTAVAGNPDKYSITSSNLSGFTAVADAALPSSPITVTIPANTAAGSYNFTLTVKNSVTGCSSVAYPVTLTINATPTVANAGANQNVCNVTTVTLTGNAPAVGTGLWSQVSGPNTAAIASPTQNSTLANGLIPGTYVFRWTISNGNCPPATSDVTVVIYGAPSTAAAGVNQQQCNNNNFTMAANTPVTGTGLWSVVNGSATITNVASAATTVTLAAGTTAVLRWSISNGNCAASTSDVTLTNDAAPTVANAGANQNLCNVTTTSLTGNTPAVGTGVWSQVSGPNTAALVTPAQPGTVVNGLIPGTYVFRWSISNGNCTPATANVTVTVAAAVTSGTVSASQVLCGPAANPAAFTETTAATGGNGTYTYQWQSSTDNVSFTDITTGGTAAVYDAPAVTQTTYYRRIVQSGVCAAATGNTLTVTINTPSTVANAGPDQTQYNSGVFTMAANTPATGTGNWSVVSGTATIANAASPATTVTIAANSTATLRWSITANSPCAVSTDDVVITYTRQANLAITKTDGSTTYTPGSTVTYTIVVQNSGPSDVTGATVSDALPAGITTASWTASTQGGASVPAATGTGSINQLVNMPSGATITYTLTLTIPAGFTGNLVNTASVTAPAGFTDPNTANNTATDTDTPNLQYNLLVTKTAPASVTAGSAINYQVTVVNNGPSDITGAAIQDIIPAAISTVSWTATVQGAATVSTASGTSNTITLTGNLPAGSANRIVINITGTVSSSATGTLTNTATVTPPGKPAVPSNTTNTTVQTQTGIQVVKSGPSTGSIAAGKSIQYNITVTNAGPSDAVNLAITDNVPADISNITWTATAQGSATVNTASGTGNSINTSGNITAGAGNSIVIQVSGTVKAAATATLTNTATATPPGGTPSSGNNTTTVTNEPGLTITKTGPASANAGSLVSYTLVIGNNGPSDAVSASIQDAIPASLTSVTWTATAAGNAVLASGASGTGNTLLVTGNIPAGISNTITVLINGTIASAASGTITNTATAVVTGKTPASSTFNTTVTNSSGIAIAKSGPATLNAGEQISYTLTISNSGPSDATGVVITDTIASQISNATWTTSVQGVAVVTAGSTGTGNRINVTGNIPAGAANNILVTITGTVSTAYAGTLTNTAYAAPAGKPPVPSAPATTTVTNKPGISIQKTAPASIAAGQQITYKLVVTNAGPSDAANVSVTDAIPSQITGTSWTVTTGGTAAVTTGSTGTGNNINVTGNIPAGAANNITVIITGTVNAAYTGTLTNTATATPNGGTPVPSPPTNTVVTNQPGITITKNGPPALNAGEQISYTLSISNNGPSDATGVVITDTIASQISNATWTTSVQGAVVVTAGSTGTGNRINVTGNIPAGAANNITVIITGTVNATYTGTLANTAYAMPPGKPVVPSAPVTTTVANKSAISIQKTAPASIAAGQQITYKLVVTNAGPSDATNVSVTDAIPSQITGTSWTVTTGGTAAVTIGSTGTGNNIAVTGNIPAGAANNITVIITGTVNATYTGTLTNTATATPDGGTPVPSPPTNTVVTNQPGITITKNGPPALNAGEQISYTLTISNSGPSDATGVVITDTIASQISNATWTTSVQGAAVVTAGSTGTGNRINVTGNIPAGTANNILITITGTVSTAYAGTLTNTAYAAPAGKPPVPSAPVTTIVANKPAVSIQKTASVNIAAGQQITYKLVVTNAGPSDAVNMVIADVIPSQITGTSWTVTTGGTAAVTTGSTGTGNNITVTGNLSAGAANNITVIITGTVNAAYTGTLTNTATATPNGGTPVPSPPTNTVVTNEPGITVAKTGPPLLNAGEQVTYTLTIGNSGPSDATGVVIADTIASQISNATWTTSVQGAAVVTAGSTGTSDKINITGNIPAGAANNILVTITGTVSPAYAGTLTNTAYATPPGKPVVPSVPVITTVTNKPAISIQKTAPASIAAGQQIMYKLVITNAGPSDATNVSVTDAIPSQITGVSWTATATGTAAITIGNTGTGSNIAVTGNIPAGTANTIIVTITGTVNTAYTGIVTNIAYATPDGSTTVPSPPTNTTVTNEPGITVSKGGPPSLRAGEQVTYTVAVGNNGPSDATGVVITDTIASQISNATWTTSVQGAAAVTAGSTGTGNRINVTGNIPAGSSNSILLTITGTVSATYAGTLTNTAYATPPGKPSVPSAPVTTPVTKTADLVIQKTGPQTIVAGEQVQYQLLVTNNGPSTASNVTIADVVPANINNVSWSAVATGTAAISGTASGTGNTVAVTATIPAGSANTVLITITGKLNAAAIISQLVNTATATPETGTTDPTPATSTVTTTVTREADLRIVKSGPVNRAVGQQVTYTLVVTNNGVSNVTGATIQDIVPAGITNVSWTTVVTGTATVSAGASGIGNTVNVTGNITAATGDSIKVTITGTALLAGTFDNIATVAAPAAVTDPNTANNSSTVSTDITTEVGLVISKSGPATANIGDHMHYTIEVSNRGLSNASSVHITDPVPAEITNVTWSVAATGNGATTFITNTPLNQNNIDITANIEGTLAGPGVITITIDGTISNTASSTIINTATAEFGGQKSSTFVTALNESADLHIIKSGATTAKAGEVVSYSIDVYNAGPGDANGVIISDIVPAAIQNVTWSAVASNPAVVISSGASGLGNNVLLAANLPHGSSNRITVTVNGTINPSFSGSITNTATATPTASNPDPTPATSTVVTDVTIQPGLSVVKTGPASISAGGTINYTIRITNNGPSDAVNVSVTDVLHSAVLNAIWSATASGAAVITGGNITDQAGNPGFTANIPAGSGNVVLVTVSGTVNAAFSGTITNTATATPLGGTPVNSGTVSTTVNSSPGIRVMKLAPAAIHAGENITYTIQVSNAGPSNAQNVSITDVIPAGITGATWSATASGSATISGGNISNQTGNISLVANIPAGSSNIIAIVVTGKVNPSFTGTILNTATATPQGDTTVTSPPVNTVVDLQANIRVIKAGLTSAAAGQVISYTIDVTNAGPSNASNINITDAVPAALQNVSWTATTSGTATVTAGATGTGNAVAVSGNIAGGSGNSIHIVVTGTISPSFSGTIINTAIATPQGGTPVNSDPVNTLVSNSPGVQVIKSAPAVVHAGETINYTIQVRNPGPSDAKDVVIADAIPAGITGFTWSATTTGTAVIAGGNLTNQTGNVSLIANIPAGAGNLVVVTISGKVNGSFTGTIINTATATPQGDTTVPSTPVPTVVDKQTGIRIIKAAPASASAGQVISYTIDVTNAGPSDASNINITDAVPAGISNTSWSATATGNATVAAGATGTGNAVAVSGNIPAGSGNSIHIVITGTINPGFSGAITNTATATPQGGTPVTSDPVNTTVNNKPGIRVIKSAPAALHAGEIINYTIQVSNAGPSNASNITIADIIPAGISNASWSATAVGAATIVGGNLSNQTGNVSLIANIPAGAANMVTVVISGKVSASFTGTITNTATATPQGDTTIPSTPVLTVVDKQTGIRIIKAAPASASAGQVISYTIDVTNTGPSDAGNTSITDAVPAALQNTSWTAIASGTAAVTAGATGTGNAIAVSGTIPAGSGNSIHIVITGTINPGFSGAITNTATAIPQGGTPVISDPVNTTVNNKTGIRVIKSAPAALHAGENISYTIQVSNAGPSNASNVTIADIIPAGISNASWSATAAGAATIVGGNLSNQTGNVSLVANIPAGAANLVTVVISGKVNASFTGTITNTATAIQQGDTTVPSAPTPTVVDKQTGIRIIKAAPASASAGQVISYTIDVTNTGPSDASNVSITDAVPAALQNTSWTATASGTAAVTAGATGTGNAVAVSGNIAAGSGNNIHIVITGTINPGFSGAITNTATATPQGGTPVNTVPVNTVVSKQTSIGLLKTAPVQVNAGNSIQYVITATNNGPSDATGIVIADVIPAAVTNVKWTITTTGSAGIVGSSTGTGNTIAVTGNIPAGSQHSIQLVVTGTVNATFSGTLANTATATLPGGTPVSSNTTNTLISRTANISIQKTAPATLFESNTIVYRIQVNNAGPSAADGTTVTDVLPGSITGTTVQVVSSTGGTANVTAAISNNTLNATIGSLPSGGQLVLEITGTIAAGTSGIITNTATVNIPAGVTDPDITNNSASAVTNSTARGKLTVEKLVTTATPYSVGKTISYVLKVTNTGTVAINPVAITDILPPLTKVSVPVTTTVPAGTTATYNAGNNTINWNIGFMAAGAVLQLGYNVTSLDSGTISNKAVTAGPRSVAIPDSVTSTITNEYLSDLGIQKTLTMQGSTLSVHDDIQFTLTVTNKGPNRATGVQVSDPLAPNLDAPRNIVASAGNAVYEAAIRNLVWNVGNMEVNATATLTFTVRVNSGGTVVNTATISGNEKDPGPGNNTGTSTPAPVNGSDIFIPNTITPNGDGKNDKFIIPGLNRYPNSVLTIYNRWGNQVYHSSNYDNSWDGSGLSGGTYYYMLELRTPQQGMQVQKGWVVLLR